MRVRRDLIVNRDSHNQQQEGKIMTNETETPIRSRHDLSFTRRDAEGGLINWSVPHDPEGSWHIGRVVGRRHFAEVAELAAHNEEMAFNALRFALSGSIEFRHNGWGIEDGFAEEVARAAVTGLRAMRDGAAAYDDEIVAKAREVDSRIDDARKLLGGR